MAKIKIVGTALVAAALVAGCSKNETTDVTTDEVMVSAGGKDLTRSEIDKMVGMRTRKRGGWASRWAFRTAAAGALRAARGLRRPTP